MLRTPHVRRGLSAACLLVLALPGLATSSAAQERTQERTQDSAQDSQERARQRVAEAAHDLHDSTEAVREAAAALQEVEAELPTAQADVDRARGELDGARARAATAAATAQRAAQAAEAARREVAAATARVEAGRAAVARLARRSYQSGPLADLRTVMTAGSPQEVLDRSALLEQVFRNENDSLHSLSRERLVLARTRAELADEQAALEAARDEAARRERRATDAAARADAAAALVRSLVDRRGRALSAAERARAGDVAEYEAAQRASRELAERIRRAAAAARAAERARAKAQAAARARAQAAAAQAAAAGRPARPVPPPPEPARPEQGGRWEWPADGPLTSRYGYRTHPIYGDRRFHAGIDIGAAQGSITVAGDDGIVTYAGPANGYGTLVLISHGTVDGADITSAYAHQSALLVSEGQRVTRGQAVGRVGSEGNSTGPHLHFEVRRDGEPVDPLDWVREP